MALQIIDGFLLKRMPTHTYILATLILGELCLQVSMSQDERILPPNKFVGLLGTCFNANSGIQLPFADLPLLLFFLYE